MKINEDLIYTGENFNFVFDTEENAKEAFSIIKGVLTNVLDLPNDASDLILVEENCKVALGDGAVNNENDGVLQICRAVANRLKKSSFYGHAYYDDWRGSYQFCADYTYEYGVLNMIMIESPEGNGICPECGEQIVCFDEYDPDMFYSCEECGAKIFDHMDMFEGVLPVTKIIEEKIY